MAYIKKAFYRKNSFFSVDYVLNYWITLYRRHVQSENIGGSIPLLSAQAEIRGHFNMIILKWSYWN